MNVLIGCECSGIVRNAFRELGHNAWSCDIRPADDNSRYHYNWDVLDVIDNKWDLCIFHPPCTDLCVSGARWFKEKIADGRQQKSIEFFMKLANAKCPRIAIENPIGIMSTRWRKPDQIIQPFEYGHTETKKTCLWLKGLPKLIPTNIVYDEMMKLPIKERNKIHYMSPGENRSKLRSKTYIGIAKAMSIQWS